MEADMSDAIINLLLQIPLAGVVVIVVIVFLNHLEKSNTRQDAAQERLIAFLGKQEESSRDFLREQRLASDETINKLANKVDAISVEVNRLSGVLIAHDTRSRTRDGS
jgi:hypothetical protein